MRLFPPSWDDALSNSLLAAYTRASPSSVTIVAEKMRALPDAEALDLEEIARAHFRMRIEDGLGRIRGVRRGGWKSKVEIVGIDKVRRALARGRGAVIWSMRLSSSTAIKQAFYEVGLPLVHLSRTDHGSPSKSALGIRIVAPLYCRAENAYLQERVQIPLNRSPRYLKTLQQRLRANQCLSIFGEHEGRANVEAPFLGSSRAFALGAPSLAWSEDAALFTAYAVRTAPFEYCVEVADEIPVDPSSTRKRFAEDAVGEFARRLEELVCRRPADWQGWTYKGIGR